MSVVDEIKKQVSPFFKDQFALLLFLLQRKENFFLLVPKYYHFSNIMIEEFKDFPIWIALSQNESITWSEELIDKYLNYWNWRNLSANEKIPWTIQLIDKYKDKWNWSKLSSNKSLPWSIQLIKKYHEKWNWDEHLTSNINTNTAIPWSADLIEMFKSNWNWGKHPFCLLNNKKINWNITLFEKFHEFIGDKQIDYLKELERKKKMSVYERMEEKFNIKIKNNFICSKSDLQNFNIQKNIDWEELCQVEGEFWTKEFIDNYKEYIDWDFLSENPSINSLEIIDEFIDYWNWEFLCYWNNIPWSIEILEKYYTLIDWKSISANEGLLWSEKLIDRFCDDLVWEELSYNKKVYWSENLVNKFFERINWKSMLQHIDEDFPWSIPFVIKIEKQIDLNEKRCIGSHKYGYYEKVIEPFLSKRFIHEYFSLIKEKK